MFYRLQSMFWPSKGKAALRAVLWLAASIPFFLWGDVMIMVALACLVAGLYYSAIWLYKFNRDKQLAMQAKAKVMQPPQAIMPNMSSPESNMFYVPPEPPTDR
jgi:hypothetical protein